MRQNTIDNFINASRPFQISELDPEISYSGEFLARNKQTGQIEIINPADLRGNPKLMEVWKKEKITRPK